jgi:predicted Zn-dependent protease
LVIVFDAAPENYDGSMNEYISNIWAKGAQLRELHPGHIKKMKAAAAVVTIPAPRGSREMRLVAVRADPTHIYRLRFEYPAESGAAQNEYRFLKMISTFGTIPENRARALTEFRLNLVDVNVGDTEASLASRSAVRDSQLEYFRTLNGLGAQDTVTPGTKVKIVVR